MAGSNNSFWFGAAANPLLAQKDLPEETGKGVDDAIGAKDEREKQTKAAQDLVDAQNSSIEEARRQKAEADANAKATAANKQARARQKAKAGENANGTILTGPLGISGEATTAKKTLLGM